MRWRRNADERLRELQRRAESGDLESAERLFVSALRSGEFVMCADALLMLGSLRANEIMLQLPLGGDRDMIAIELGRALIALGWQPNLTVGGFATVSPEMWWDLPAIKITGDFGRTKSRRVPSHIRIWGPGGIEPGARDLQAPNMIFRVGKRRGKSLPHKVLQEIERRGRAVDRQLAPCVYYLWRWTGTSLVGPKAGFDFHYPVNQAYHYTRSQPDRRERPYDDPRDTRERNWDWFMRGARIGWLPGEAPPPRHGLSSEEITAWLARPERMEAIKAMLYGDLWLASDWLVENAEYGRVGGGSVEHPYPLDPRLMIQPGQARVPLEDGMFRANPDVDLRELERALEISPGDFMLRASYARSLMRDGDSTAAYTQAVQALRSALPLILQGNTSLVKEIAETARLPHRRHPVDVLNNLFSPGEIVGAWISGLKTKKARAEAMGRLWRPVWQRRKDREVHPEGEFDGAGRWYPSQREDGRGDVTTQVRSPSRNWPYSYMLRARTKAHCKELVNLALQGESSPPDVDQRMRGMANEVIAKAWPRLRRSRYNPDERTRRAQRAAAGGDPRAEARVLRDRLRTRTILPEAVRLAACLGHVPAQLAIDWVPPEPPFGSPDCVMLTVAQDNEWGHRMAALWAYALVKGTEWIWGEANQTGHSSPGSPGFFPALSMAPNDALKLIETLLASGDPCPEANTHPRRLQLDGFIDRLSDVVYELDTSAFDSQDNEYAPGADHYLLAEAAGQWTRGLIDALEPWGNNSHGRSRRSLWGNRHTLGQLWQIGPDDSVPSVYVPFYASMAREAYRQSVWAVDYYRGGTNRPGKVMDKAQLDVERWARAIMLPEVLA